jgi:hypothetical protein
VEGGVLKSAINVHLLDEILIALIDVFGPAAAIDSRKKFFSYALSMIRSSICQPSFSGTAYSSIPTSCSRS